MEKIKWCFRIKDGIRIKKPSDEISNSYLELSKSSLKSAETIIRQSLLWATVMAYYAEYYALYSFLTKIGIKCENHFCSILLVKLLLGKEKVKVIEEHRQKRVSAQYYLKVGQEKEVESILREAKFFVAEFERFVTNLNEDEIKEFRQRIEEFF